MIATLLLTVLALNGPPPAPRAVSAAERAAVAVLSQYLASGPEAVWNELADDAALRRMGQASAVREIGARLGPPQGASWSLQTAVPSVANRMAIFGVDFETGGDDTVEFEMHEQAGGWRVLDVRTSAEPVASRRFLPAAAPVKATPRRHQIDRRLPLVVALPALLVGILGVSLTSTITSRVFLSISAACVVAAVALAVLPLIPQRASATPAVAVVNPLAPGTVSLGDLLPLRQAFAAGDIAPFEKFRTEDPLQRDVARQWQAALEIREERFDRARLALSRLTPGVTYSMAEILRARLAHQESKDVDAVSAYERAIAIGPGRDQLWLEAAETLALLGFDDRAEEYFHRTARIGTRRPEVYYTLAVLAGMRSSHQEAARLLLSAWRMRPAERAEVVGVPVLWRVIRMPAVARALQLHRAEEASFAGRADRPIALPPGGAAEVTGEHLRLRAGGGSIDIAGGASITPPGAVLLDAGAWRRRMDEEALARFSDLRPRVSAAAFAEKTFRDRTLTTAAALADRNRWTDLLDLTSTLSGRDERVPLELMILRGRALVRADRTHDLQPLIRDVLLNPSFRRKKDPGSMRLVAELLAASDDYDPAIALLSRVRDQMELPGVEQRIRQLEIEKTLSESYRVLKTEHFDVLYPNDTDPASVERFGKILESEYARLRPAWFPGLAIRRVKVNLLWWEEFRLYSGSDYIAGLFTNEMFLPLAGLDEFTPRAVSIVTHELVHAMLAEATRNLAPRWFHEGLASRLEMNETAENGFQKYRDDRYLSVALLDAVTEASVDPDLIGEAYSLSEGTVRFVEARFGRAGIQKMIAAFREGADSTEAIRAATGLSVPDLDAAARAWGSTQPHLFEGNVVRYDDQRPRFRDR